MLLLFINLLKIFINAVNFKSTMAFDRITFCNVPAPKQANINSELQWIGSALGLFGERDKESSCFRVFVILLHSTRKNRQLTSDQIAQLTNLSRGTVCYHLNHLKRTGLVTYDEQGYCVVEGSLSKAIEGIESRLIDMLSLMRTVAKDIDYRLD